MTFKAERSPEGGTKEKDGTFQRSASQSARLCCMVLRNRFSVVETNQKRALQSKAIWKHVRVRIASVWE